MSNRHHDHHAIRHARQRLALRNAQEAEAKGKAAPKATRRAKAARRHLLEALRLADMAEV